jgi:DNA-binding response OmpR family regulator
MAILIVEDIDRMRAFIEQGLRERGYEVESAVTAAEGEEFGLKRSYELILLDVMLPDGDGFEVCRNLRKKGVRTPILMLTALSSPSDIVSGLEAGADDYLCKPFEFAELVARIRALLRRGQTQETTLRFEDIEMDVVSRKVKRNGMPIQLNGRAFALLEFFLRNPNRVLSRSEISLNVWETEFDNESNVIDVFVSTLRKKIDRPFPRKLIQTVVMEGYMLSVPQSEPALLRT